jgi:hypothetical protein
MKPRAFPVTLGRSHFPLSDTRAPISAQLVKLPGCVSVAQIVRVLLGSPARAGANLSNRPAARRRLRERFLPLEGVVFRPRAKV